jgi:hypothetical protein
MSDLLQSNEMWKKKQKWQPGEENAKIDWWNVIS